MNPSDQSFLDHAETLIRVMRLDDPEFQHSGFIDALNLIREQGTPKALAGLVSQITSGQLAIYRIQGIDTMAALRVSLDEMTQARTALSVIAEQLKTVE